MADSDSTVYIVLLVVLVPVLAGLAYLFIDFYRRTGGAIPRPRKIGAKKKKKELMKMGLRPAGEE